MPLYDFSCKECGFIDEFVTHIDADSMPCPKCGATMIRKFPLYGLVKIKYPLWVDRIDEIHKRQADKGERLRMVYPREVIR
jgi:putative FmdB family regulatory protein